MRLKTITEHFQSTHLSPGITGGRCASPSGVAGVHGPGVQGSLLLRVDDRRDTMRRHPRPVLHSPVVTLGLGWCHHGTLTDVRTALLVGLFDGRGW